MAMTATASTTLAPSPSLLARMRTALETRMMGRAARQSADRLAEQLTSMSDHSLRDIGIRRDQIPDVIKAHQLRASVSLPL